MCTYIVLITSAAESGCYIYYARARIVVSSLHEKINRVAGPAVLRAIIRGSSLPQPPLGAVCGDDSVLSLVTWAPARFRFSCYCRSVKDDTRRCRERALRRSGVRRALPMCATSSTGAAALTGPMISMDQRRAVAEQEVFGASPCLYLLFILVMVRLGYAS